MSVARDTLYADMPSRDSRRETRQTTKYLSRGWDSTWIVEYKRIVVGAPHTAVDRICNAGMAD
jgi:hypothetical protein